MSAARASQVRCKCRKKKKARKETEDVTLNEKDLCDNVDVDAGSFDPFYVVDNGNNIGNDNVNVEGGSFDPFDYNNDGEADNHGEGGTEGVGIGGRYEEESRLIDPSETWREIEDYFNDSNLWPKPSTDFFLRDTKKKGDGMKAIVYRALINPRQDSNFDLLLCEDETLYHFHLTSTFHGMPKDKVVEAVTATNLHMVTQALEEKISEADTLRESSMIL